jgi:hypothetical protein
VPYHPMNHDELVVMVTGVPAHTGKLATVRADGRPHVVPIWFALDVSTAQPTPPSGTSSSIPAPAR